VAGLAERAHELAVKNLDQKTKSIYRENVQLAEALSMHLKDSEELRKVVDRLTAENGELKFNRDFHHQMVETQVSEATKHKKKIQQLQSKVQELESALMKMVNEFEEEKNKMKRKCSSQTHQLQCEVAVLRRNAQLQAKESNHVKLLARQLLDQRTDVEDFFITALTEVKERAKHTQEDYRKAAQSDYQQRLKEAQDGQSVFPKIKTFKPLPNSTNSVYEDLKQAREWGVGAGEQVSLSDLTWEQKEQVLRVMFAQMNGKRAKPVSNSKDRMGTGMELVIT
jgi:chromosome segregation ATPase